MMMPHPTAIWGRFAPGPGTGRRNSPDMGAWGRARRVVWPEPREAEVRLPGRGGSRCIGPCEQ